MLERDAGAGLALGAGEVGASMARGRQGAVGGQLWRAFRVGGDGRAGEGGEGWGGWEGTGAAALAAVHCDAKGIGRDVVSNKPSKLRGNTAEKTTAYAASQGLHPSSQTAASKQSPDGRTPTSCRYHGTQHAKVWKKGFLNSIHQTTPPRKQSPRDTAPNATPMPDSAPSLSHTQPRHAAGPPLRRNNSPPLRDAPRLFVQANPSASSPSPCHTHLHDHPPRRADDQDERQRGQDAGAGLVGRADDAAERDLAARRLLVVARAAGGGVADAGAALVGRDGAGDLRDEQVLEDGHRAHLLANAEVAVPHGLIPAAAAHVGRLAGALGRGRLGGGGEPRHDEGGRPGRQLRGDGEPAGEVGFEGRLVRVAGLWGGELARHFRHDHAAGGGLLGGVVQAGGLDEEDAGAVVDEAGEAGAPGGVAVGLERG